MKHDEELRARLEELKKPFRAECLLCGGTLFCGSTPEEAERLANEHVVAGHGPLVRVWEVPRG